MAVFEVAVTFSNGTRRSRPTVAHTAQDALELLRAEVEDEVPAAADRAGFVYEVRAIADEEGRLERLLLEGERRRLDEEFYRHK